MEERAGSDLYESQILAKTEGTELFFFSERWKSICMEDKKLNREINHCKWNTAQVWLDKPSRETSHGQQCVSSVLV